MERLERHYNEGQYPGASNRSIIARAWRDDEYLESLSEPLRSQIPESPVGDIDFGVVYRGGQIHEIWAGTAAASCSTAAATCSTAAASCSTAAANCGYRRRL